MSDRDDPDTRPLKARILDYCTRTDYVTFAELQNHFAIGGGDHSIEMQPNLVLWAGLNGEASTAIIELLAEKALHVHPSTQLVYLIDGRSLTLPVPKRIPRNGFKKLHWLPSTLRTVPLGQRRK